MEFAVMPDHLFGASVRINGQWLGVVEEQALHFSMKGTGAYIMLVEIAPLAADPSGEVYPLPLARVLRIKDGALVEPETEPDGMLHVRRAGRLHQLHVVYPKVDALGGCLETLPLPLQNETVDFDHDGRLDTAETFFTSQCGHLRVRSATGTILLQEVYPDNGLRIEVVDLNRDNRPELLIFWEERAGRDGLSVQRMQHWDPSDASLAGYEGFTGVRRLGRGEVLIEKQQRTSYREVIDLYRYVRRAGESAEFPFVRREERLLMRADAPVDTLEALFESLEIGDESGAKAYLARVATWAEVARAVGKPYSHEIGQVKDGRGAVRAFEWIYEGFYDAERVLSVEMVKEPDAVSEWKVARLTRTEKP
jgi:hypothetical protein